MAFSLPFLRRRPKISSGITLGGTTKFSPSTNLPVAGRTMLSKGYGRGPFVPGNRPSPKGPSAPYFLPGQKLANYNAYVRQLPPQAAAIAEELREVIPKRSDIAPIIGQVEINAKRFGGIASSKIIPSSGPVMGGVLEIKFANGKKMTINPLSRKIFVE